MKKLILIGGMAVLLMISAFLIYFFIDKNKPYSYHSDGQIIQNMVKIKNKKYDMTIHESSGIRMKNDMILTSAHSVRDADSLSIEGKKYIIAKWDEYYDFALLSPKIPLDIPEFFFQNYKKNTVFAFVMRNGKWEKIMGKIIDSNVEMRALNPHGKMQTIFVKYLTNLDVKTGDSGAPIFGENYEIIDIIHTDMVGK